MTITVLIENHGDREGRGLESEHGLSLLVDTGRGAFLFDTGASGRFLDNARRLGLDLSGIPCAAISHGHLDHGGGLGTFLEANRRARVFVQRGAFDGHFARRKLAGHRSIGLDPDIHLRHRERFVTVVESAEMLPGVRLEADIPAGRPLPRDTRRFTRRDGVRHLPDDFCHEMMAVVRASDGLAVLTGCSHRGVLNVLETAEQRFPGETISVLVGGFHLMDPGPGRLSEPEEEVAMIGRLLRARDSLRVWTGHRTGSRAIELLQCELGDRIGILSTGQVIEV